MKSSQFPDAVYREAIAAAERGDFDSIPETLRRRYYRNFFEMFKDKMAMAPNLDGTCGIWLWGETGVGKSAKARADYPGAYFKTADKWWDGYKGEEFVIIDGIDKKHARLGPEIRCWADCWSFEAEVRRRGIIMIRPKVICITSRYTPDEIWKDTQTGAAMSRRFSIVEIKK